MMRVTYLGHSGFLLEMEDALLLFDYYQGSLPEMDPEKTLFVFVSHVHYDHYNPDILKSVSYTHLTLPTTERV